MVAFRKTATSRRVFGEPHVKEPLELITRLLNVRYVFNGYATAPPRMVRSKGAKYVIGVFAPI